MSITAEYRLCENDGILRDAMDGIISSLRISKKNVIFINVSYHEDKKSDVLYSGMNYILKMRGEQNDNSRVLFYGFESLDSLKKKPEASILKSPAVEYVRLPFDLFSLEKLLVKLSPISNKHRPLDKDTEKLLADSRDKELHAEVRGFVHDWRNGVTYLTALLNKLREHQNDSKAVQENINELMRYRVDFISKKCASYNTMRNSVELKFKKCKKITTLPKIMQISEESYASLRSSLEKALKGKGSVRALISALQKTIDSLKEVEDLLDECTKR
jgi:hypothetical protein